MGRGGGRRSPPHSYMGEGGDNRWSSLMSEEDGHSGGGDSGGEEGGDAFPPPSKVEFSEFLGKIQESNNGGRSGHHGKAKSGHISSTKGGKSGGAGGGFSFPPPSMDERSSFLDESSSSPASIQGIKAMSGQVSSTNGGKSGGADGGGAFPPPAKDERSYFLGESSSASRKIHEGNIGGSSNHHEHTSGGHGSSKNGSRHSGDDGETKEDRTRAREERALAKAARAEERARRHAARHARDNERLPEGGVPEDGTGTHSSMQVCTAEAQALSGDMAAAINAPAFYPAAHTCVLATPAPFWGTLASNPSAPSHYPSLGSAQLDPPSHSPMRMEEPLIPYGPGTPSKAHLSAHEKEGEGMDVEGEAMGYPPNAWKAQQSAQEKEGVNMDVEGDAMGRPANAWKAPKFFPISLEDGPCQLGQDGKSVKLNPARVQANVQRLECGLVGHTFGRKLPYHVLKLALERRWLAFGEFKLITLSSECFICIFKDAAARDSILLKGPWYIAGQIIGLDKWSPTFNPNTPMGLSSPIWVRLPSLPLIYWDNDCIARIVSRIGDPLWVDSQTNEWGRSTFARVCVKVDLSKPLPPGVWVEGLHGNFYQRVEYEGISLLCFKCGMVGHKMEHCKSQSPPSSQKEKPTQMDQDGPSKDHDHLAVEQEMGDHGSTPLHDPPAESQMEGYGAWTVVTRKPKKKKAPTPTPQPDRATSPKGAKSTSKGKETCLMEDVQGATTSLPPLASTGLFTFGGSSPKPKPNRSISRNHKMTKSSRNPAEHTPRELALLEAKLPKKRSKTTPAADDAGDPSTSMIP